MSVTRLLRIARQRLRALTRGSSLDDELEQELALHVELMTKELADSGIPLEEARLTARRAFGNVALVADRSRDQRRVGWLLDLTRDLRDAVRLVRRQPGFTVMAVASLAIGIGATSAVFGAVRAVMFDPLALPNADRLVTIRTTTPADREQVRGSTMADFFEWRDGGRRTIDAIGVSINGQSDWGAEADGTPAERVIGQIASAGLFSTLGAPPFMGRWYTDEESRRDQPIMVVLISYRLWQRRYHGDPDVLTRRVRVDNVVMSIVGVMPEDFRFQDRRVEYWVPLRMAPSQATEPARFYNVVARMKPDVTVGQAQSDLESLRASVHANDAPTGGVWGVRVSSLRDDIYGWAKTPLLILQAFVVLILIMACANVAGLLLARGTARQREVAMRVALGAGRGRVIRQLLTESMLLSAIGGALGLFLAWLAIRSFTLVMSAPVGSPQIATIHISTPLMLVSIALSLLTGIAFGIVPALTSTRINVIGALKDAPAAGTTSPRQRARSAFVALQIATALVLLVGAGLLISSFVRLVTRDVNFDERGMLTFDFRVSATYTRSIGTFRGFNYLEVTSPPSRTIAQVHDRLSEIPGARAVAGISHPLFVSLLVPTAGVLLDGGVPHAVGGGRAVPSTTYFLVTPNFFTTIKAAVVAGRDISTADTDASPWVVVVNETAARRLWPGKDAIGQHVTMDIVPEERSREVVGVVRDIPVHRPDVEPRAVVYASYLQQPLRSRAPYGVLFGQMTFLLRAEGDPLALVPAARKAVESVDAGRPLSNIAVLDEYGKPMEERRNYVAALGIFATTATLLAAIGVYGVMSYGVSQRTREIGIRRTLGASRREIVMLIGRRAIAMTIAGLTAGLAVSLAVTRLIASQLWGVSPTDPVTMVGVSLLLAVVAAVACVVPTRRALSVDPTTALRAD